MNYLQANLCLLCVTFCWSTEVVIFACIPDTVSPFAVTPITFLVGVVCVVVCMMARDRRAVDIAYQMPLYPERDISKEAADRFIKHFAYAKEHYFTKIMQG